MGIWCDRKEGGGRDLGSILSYCGQRLVVFTCMYSQPGKYIHHATSKPIIIIIIIIILYHKS